METVKSYTERQEDRIAEIKAKELSNYNRAHAKMEPTMKFRVWEPARKWAALLPGPVLQQLFIEPTATGGFEHWLNVPRVSE